MIQRKSLTCLDELTRSGLKSGDRIHLGVVGAGQVSDDVLYWEADQTGIVVCTRFRSNLKIPWTQVIECWPLEKESAEFVV